ncbi:MAG: sulfatase-like hydrolase/transferase [Bifidobacteriaceae bacterium]|jgi:hypothetical protein|nr:sulfatase-like hydrolase/transferase [Bifidobacteriaceae bacterium]
MPSEGTQVGWRRRSGRPQRRPLALTGLALWAAAACALAMPNPAQAYIDPATTSYLIQVVSGLVITLSVAIGVFFRRIVLFMTTAGAKAAALWAVATAPRRRGRSRSQARARAAGRAGGWTDAAASGGDQAGGDQAGAARDQARRARSVAVVESAAIAPVSATGGAARRRVDGIGQGLDGGLTDQPGAGRSAAGGPSRTDARLAAKHPGLAVGKWSFLWGDRRGFGRRLGTALPVALAPAFLLFVFGPLDIYRRNQAEFRFRPSDFMGPLTTMFALTAVAVLVVLVVLRGRIFDVAVSLVLGLTLALWVQGTFLNTDLGPLTGVPVRWEKHLGTALVNTAVWAGLMVAPLLLRLVWRRLWAVFAWLAPTALTAALGVGLIGVFAETGGPAPFEPSVKVPTYEGAFTASSTANQYLFVLDMMDQDFVNEITADDAEFFARELDGFTEFDANISNYTNTLPGAAAMLTGVPYHYETPAEEYFARAYRDSDFLPALRQAGYSTNIYATNRFSYYNISDIEDVADNLTVVDEEVVPEVVVKGLLRLDAARHAPHIAKATFWPSSDPFRHATRTSERGEAFINDNRHFYENLHASGIEVDGPRPRFSFIHLDGAHYPALIDRDVRPVEKDSVSLSEQARGAFRVVFDYIAELKRVGAYKDATIVITADHGRWASNGDLEGLLRPRLTALFVKPAGAEGTPMRRSAAPTDMTNVRATMLADAGLKHAVPTVFELDPDAPAPRDFWFRRGLPPDGVTIEHWRITGDAREWSNWQMVDVFDPIYPE